MSSELLEILNLGGGVQSSRLLEESIAGDLPRLDAAIFADTLWEPQHVYDHVDYLTDKAKRAGIPVYRVNAGDLRADALRSQVRGLASEGHRWASMPLFTLKVWYPIQSDIDLLEGAVACFEDKPGSDIDPSEFLWLPEDETDEWMQREATKLRKILAKLRNGVPVEQRGMIKRQCTKEYKIEPIEKFIKTELLGLQPGARWPKECVVRQWFGISLDESQRCRATHAAWKVHWYPLVDRLVTRLACYAWFAERGLPLPKRSACKGCPFHDNPEWREMKIERPAEFDDACCFDDGIRKCGGMRGDCFLHRTCQPLRDVDVSNDVDRGQLLLVGIDDPQLLSCESGHCFV